MLNALKRGKAWRQVGNRSLVVVVVGVGVGAGAGVGVVVAAVIVVVVVAAVVVVVVGLVNSTISFFNYRSVIVVTLFALSPDSHDTIQQPEKM